MVPGLLQALENSALAELGRAAGGLQAVLHLFAGADLLDISGFSAPSLVS